MYGVSTYYASIDVVKCHMVFDMFVTIKGILVHISDAAMYL